MEKINVNGKVKTYGKLGELIEKGKKLSLKTKAWIGGALVVIAVVITIVAANIDKTDPNMPSPNIFPKQTVSETVTNNQASPTNVSAPEVHYEWDDILIMTGTSIAAEPGGATIRRVTNSEGKKVNGKLVANMGDYYLVSWNGKEVDPDVANDHSILGFVEAGAVYSPTGLYAVSAHETSPEERYVYMTNGPVYIRSTPEVINNRNLKEGEKPKKGNTITSVPNGNYIRVIAKTDAINPDESEWGIVAWCEEKVDSNGTKTMVTHTGYMYDPYSWGITVSAADMARMADQVYDYVYLHSEKGRGVNCRKEPNISDESRLFTADNTTYRKIGEVTNEQGKWHKCVTGNTIFYVKDGPYVSAYQAKPTIPGLSSLNLGYYYEKTM